MQKMTIHCQLLTMREQEAEKDTSRLTQTDPVEFLRVGGRARPQKTTQLSSKVDAITAWQVHESMEILVLF